jgi:hypothetical protein
MPIHSENLPETNSTTISKEIKRSNYEQKSNLTLLQNNNISQFVQIKDKAGKNHNNLILNQ